jgi:AraC family L-rhamnose operon regulatory protein RhaS
MNKYFLADKTRGGLSLHVEKATINANFAMHEHDFSELAVITGGTALHSIEGDEYFIEAGDIFVINGNVSHGFSKVNDLSIYNVMYDSRQIFEQSPDLKKLPGFHVLFFLEPYYRKAHNFESKLKLDSAGLSYVQFLLESMIKEYDMAADGYISMMRSYLINLVVYLSRTYKKGNNKEMNNLLVIAKSVAFMEKHFTEHMTLKDLAVLASASERQFGRVFKQVYQTSPFEYIIRLRLHKACDLLCYSDSSITQTAYECGFSDSNYFSRCFRDEFGISPRQMKRYIFPRVYIQHEFQNFP